MISSLPATHSQWLERLLIISDFGLVKPPPHATLESSISRPCRRRRRKHASTTFHTRLSRLFHPLFSASHAPAIESFDPLGACDVDDIRRIHVGSGDSVRYRTLVPELDIVPWSRDGEVECGLSLTCYSLLGTIHFHVRSHYLCRRIASRLFGETWEYRASRHRKSPFITEDMRRPAAGIVYEIKNR